MESTSTHSNARTFTSHAPPSTGADARSVSGLTRPSTSRASSIRPSTPFFWRNPNGNSTRFLTLTSSA